MIFQNLNEHQLARILAANMDAPTWPGLRDPEVIERAQTYAKASGLWDRLAEKNEPFPSDAFSFSSYQKFKTTGIRAGYESAYHELLDRIRRAAIALWLNHPGADFTRFQDQLWDLCNGSWTLPAHDYNHIELVNSETGRLLAEYDWLFADRLDKRVHERIASEVTERLLNIAHDWRKPDWWRTTGNNWNSVCNANLIQAGFYLIKDSGQLTNFVHPLYRRLDYALAYFPEDGGCPEGPGYWEYGFGHFVDAAVALHQRTGGQINLLDDPHVKKICRFPLAVHLRGKLRATFADSGSGYAGASVVLKINHLTPIPELFAMIEPIDSGLPKVEDLRGLALYRGEHVQAESDGSDYFMPGLGFVKLHAGNQVVLAAVAGRNDVAHNHNDIGSFILAAGDTALLTDPGAPIYIEQTFSPKRYEMLFCRTRGHSLPIINGHEQKSGSEFFGTIQATNLSVGGETTNASKAADEPRVEKTIEIDMSHAYPDPTLKKLVRTFRAAPDGKVKMSDVYRFSQKPDSLEEAFVTFEPVTIAADKQSAIIGQGNRSLRLQAEAPGKFAVETFAHPAHQGRDQRTLNRIAFHPASLSADMQLNFRFELAGA